MIQAPKAVFFDLDETLIENLIPIPELFASAFNDVIAEHSDVNSDKFFQFFRQSAAQLWGNMFASNVPPEQQLINCFESALHEASGSAESHTQDLSNTLYQQFLLRSARNTRLQAGAIDTLQQLSKAGFITGIITNGIEQVQLGKINALNLQSQVDHVVVSAQARAHKPDEKVFSLALSRAGVNSTQAWQIGDHAHNDVAGAIRAGMGGIFYDPSGLRASTAFTQIEEKPNHVIKHLSEVMALATDF